MTKNGILWLLLACALVAIGVTADAEEPDTGNDSVEEVFKSYQAATQENDWKTLFLLGTAQRQDAAILEIAVSAAVSNDDTLRNLVRKHGLDWKQFDREWTEAENARFMTDFPKIAASIGKQAKGKVKLYVAARQHLQRKNDPVTAKVLELKNVVANGTTASGESIETHTLVERHHDADGKEIGQASRDVSVTARLWFRQINGKWYLATPSEVSSEKDR